MCTLTTAGGLLPAGTPSTAMSTIFPLPFFSWSLGRRDREKYKPDKYQPACLSMLEEGYPNKIRTNSGVGCRRLNRSSTHLPIFGRLARVVLWGGFHFDAATVSEAGAVLVNGGEVQVICYAVRITVVRCLSKSGWFQGAATVWQHETVGELCGDKCISRNAIKRGA